MQCPNPKCDYTGYEESGLCPKCGSKLLPNIKFYESKIKPISFFKKVFHYIGQVIFRAIESVICSVCAYFVIYLFIFGYNGLCREISSWIPIDFYSELTKYVQWASYALVTFLVFKYRWKKLET